MGKDGHDGKVIPIDQHRWRQNFRWSPPYGSRTQIDTINPHAEMTEDMCASILQRMLDVLHEKKQLPTIFQQEMENIRARIVETWGENVPSSIQNLLQEIIEALRARSARQK